MIVFLVFHLLESRGIAALDFLQKPILRTCALDTNWEKKGIKKNEILFEGK